MSTELMIPYNYLILCRPLLLMPSIFPSFRVFSNKSVLLIRWTKYWSFSFSISPPSEYSRLISFSIDRFDHLIVQGTLKSLLQHHSSKASILWHSVFFMVQNVATLYHFNCPVQQQKKKLRYEKKLRICPLCRKKESIEILSEEVHMLGLQDKYLKLTIINMLKEVKELCA